MRLDNRRPDQLRPMTLAPGYTRWAEGSALITQGETVVLCNATVEERLPPWMARANENRGWITAEYSMLPRSTLSRTARETTPGPRTQEIRRLIGRSLRAAVRLDLLGRRQIIVDCDVLQADGGTRTAAVTGGYVALAMALQNLIAAGIVPPEAMLSPVAAVSVGVVGGEPLLDLCYEEDLRAEVDMNVVMVPPMDAGRFVEIQGTAEGRPFDRAVLNRLLDLAAAGIEALLATQQTALAAA
jgi:ribonuclease PH